MLSRKLKIAETAIESHQSCREESESPDQKEQVQLKNGHLETNSNNANNIITTSNHFLSPLWKRFYDLECCLNEELHRFRFESKITHIYNPVEYASQIHCEYLRRYLNDGRNKEVLFCGMNPGPNGMGQTGVISLITH